MKLRLAGMKQRRWPCGPRAVDHLLSRVSQVLWKRSARAAPGLEFRVLFSCSRFPSNQSSGNRWVSVKTLPPVVTVVFTRYLVVGPAPVLGLAILTS
jgi:hypothetical protein